MSASLLQRAVRGFAVYDLSVTVPFATPWTAEAMLGVMRWVNGGLSLSGETVPAFTPLHLFFVTLFGVLAVIWELVRIRQPTALHGAIDTVGRGLVASWRVLALMQGASQVQGALLLGGRREALASAPR